MQSSGKEKATVYLGMSTESSMIDITNMAGLARLLVI